MSNNSSVKSDNWAFLPLVILLKCSTTPAKLSCPVCLRLSWNCDELSTSVSSPNIGSRRGLFGATTKLLVEKKESRLWWPNRFVVSVPGAKSRFKNAEVVPAC